jgi:hypothetical protein
MYANNYAAVPSLWLRNVAYEVLKQKYMLYKSMKTE